MESLEGVHHLPVLIHGAAARAAREAGENDAVLLHLHGVNQARVAARVRSLITGVHQVAVAAVGTLEADQAGQEDITAKI